MINSGQPYLMQAGNMLKALRTVREDADYEIDKTLKHSAAERWVDDAGEIIQHESKLAAEFAKMSLRVGEVI